MKATCIVGSPRPNGSTAYLIDTMIRGMHAANIETVKHCVGEKTIQYCLGCKKCYIDGKCIQQDDVWGMVSDLLDSDYVAIAAPSYWADVPGQLKTFFDRNTPYGDTNPNRIRKAAKKIKGIAIALRAGTHDEENQLILQSIRHYYGHLGITPVKSISICGVDTLEDLLEKHQKEVQELYALGANLLGL